MKNGMTGATAQPVPLFGSSWVALYCLLKESLSRPEDSSRMIDEDDCDGPLGH
jgi:hypothetical protein